MSDVYIMNTAFLDSFSSPLPTWRDQKPRLASPPANCRLCGEPLIEIEFKKYFALVCDNDRCHMFRQPQGYRSKDPNPEPALSYLEQRKTNYQALRALGIPCIKASILSSNKRTEEIKEQARLGSTQLTLLRGY